MDVIAFRQAPPHHHVPRRRIGGTFEVAAKPSDFDDVIRYGGLCLRSHRLCLDQVVQQVRFRGVPGAGGRQVCL